MNRMVALVIVLMMPLTLSCAKKIKVGPEGARVIAKNAYIYGYPMLENYKLMYAYAIYQDGKYFRAPFNNMAVVTPDTVSTDSTGAAVTLGSPFAMAWIDLRAEPVVITVPPMKEGSRYHVQLTDMYTFEFGQLSTEKDGNKGASYMIVPPGWSGRTPDQITRVIGCETSFALVVIRGHGPGIEATATTEAFLMNFSVERLATFQDTKAPRAQAVIFPPYSQETVNTPGFFQYLIFLLQFCPVHPSEIHERAEFAKLGIAAGETFDIGYMDKAILEAVKAGMEDGRAEIAAAAAKTPEDRVMYGTRADLKNDFLARAVAAKVRLYGPPRI